jgi:hypothetical protein
MAAGEYHRRPKDRCASIDPYNLHRTLGPLVLRGLSAEQADWGSLQGNCLPPQKKKEHLAMLLQGVLFLT